MTTDPRRILHVDMDAFYASVEQRDDPSLRGRPVAVGGTRRGVVAAASYEARAFGVRSAMPTARALRLCPGLVVVPPDFERYHAVSCRVFELFREVTPLVEPLSIDEAFLDVTENAWGESLGMQVARRIKERIHDETALTASAGVAPNKLLAKIASGFRKPDGLTVVAPSRIQAFLEKLPVDALYGVGPVTAAKLHAIGVERVPDVLHVGLSALRQVVGSYATALLEMARGIDDRPVIADRVRKSVGSENTFEEDLTDFARIRVEVDALARGLVPWLEENDALARTVTLKVRYSDFETITRSATRRPGTRSEDEIAERARALLVKTEAGSRPVRLLGVSLHGLEGEGDDLVELEDGQLLLPFGRARVEAP